MNEQELLEHLAKTSVPNLERMEYGFSHWDCTAFYETSLGRIDYILELKCRETHYPELLIEQVKYDWLIEEAGKRSARPAYINWTPKGIFAWDLYRVREPHWGTHELPSTTKFGDPRLVPKVVGFLPVADAVRLP
jgi:hypothetical protein